jgi:hypothetical protein
VAQWGLLHRKQKNVIFSQSGTVAHIERYLEFTNLMCANKHNRELESWLQRYRLSGLAEGQRYFRLTGQRAQLCYRSALDL